MKADDCAPPPVLGLIASMLSIYKAVGQQNVPRLKGYPMKMKKLSVQIDILKNY